MTQAQLPDGTILDFPDDTPFEVIQGTVRRELGIATQAPIQAPTQDVIQANFTPGDGAVSPEIETDGAPVPGEKDAPDILDRIGNRFEERGVQFQEIRQRHEEGQNFGVTALQTIGKIGAGAVVDVIGEGITTAVTSAFDIIESVAPETSQDIVDGFEAIMGTDAVKAAGEAIGGGIEVYSNWARANPSASDTLDAVANLAIVFAPVKIKPRAPTGPGAIGRAGERVSARGAAQTAVQRVDFLEDLVSPEATKKVRTEAAARTADPTAFTPGRVTATASEAETAATVGELGGISAKNTFRQNLRVVEGGIEREAVALEKALKAQPFKIPREAIIAENKALQARLAESPLLVGDASKVAKKVGAEAERQLKKHGATGVGMLRARKGLDSWVRRQKPRVFDPASESAMSVAVREVRTSMNKLIDDFAPSVKVKESLRKQSNLFSAAENIAPKAAAEIGGKAQRLWDRAKGVVGLKEAGALGLTVLGLGTTGTAQAAVAGYLAFRAGRFVMSPQAKKAFGSLLGASDKALRTAKDPKFIKQLRADRIAVIELLKGFEDEK